MHKSHWLIRNDQICIFKIGPYGHWKTFAVGSIDKRISTCSLTCPAVGRATPVIILTAVLLPAPLCPKSPITSPEGNRYTQNSTLQWKSHKCCSMAHRVSNHRHYATYSSHTRLSVATSFILQASKRRCKENEEENAQGHAANLRLSWNLKRLFFFFCI